MTDDITRGLTALADEAQPADIDSHTVIQLAHAHTRARRAVVTAAFASLVAIGALTVAISAWQDPSATTPVTSQTTSSAPAPPTVSQESPTDSPPTSPGIRDIPTAEETAARKTRLQTDIVAAFDRILPDGWQHSAFGFGCDQTGCFAEGDVIDDAGTTLNFFVYTSDSLGDEGDCFAPYCVRAEVLDDGTAVQLSKGEHEGLGSEKEKTLTVNAQRPDGTMLSMLVSWPASKQTPALTDEQWLQFGKALTF